MIRIVRTATDLDGTMTAVPEIGDSAAHTAIVRDAKVTGRPRIGTVGESAVGTAIVPGAMLTGRPLTVIGGSSEHRTVIAPRVRAHPVPRATSRAGMVIGRTPIVIGGSSGRPTVSGRGVTGPGPMVIRRDATRTAPRENVHATIAPILRRHHASGPPVTPRAVIRAGMNSSRIAGAGRATAPPTARPSRARGPDRRTGILRRPGWAAT